MSIWLICVCLLHYVSNFCGDRFNFSIFSYEFFDCGLCRVAMEFGIYVYVVGWGEGTMFNRFGVFGAYISIHTSTM